jgi:excinuclease ABC subunit C
MFEELKKQVKELPTRPGVYIYSDLSGTIIYVGKAKSLRHRVGSYFQSNLDPTSKTAALVSNISSLRYIEAGSEFEALILEAELIKKYRPKYNIMLKDDKSYLYIVIRSVHFEHEKATIKYLRIETARKTDLDSISGLKEVFGPYPDGKTAKEILRMLRKIFPYADCSDGKFSRYQKLKSPCLFGHLGLCYGPCVDSSQENIKKINNSINSIKKILQGKSSDIVDDLKSKMTRYSKSEDFEEAARLRDVLSKFNYLRQDFNLPEEYIENPYLVSDLIRKSLEEIKDFLPVIQTLPNRIECYDIANISGKDAVASMVVATTGRIDKSQYKRFKIRLKDEPDDFGMMREVLTRRLKRSDWPLPDFILLDGGKGQLSTILKVMSELNVNIPVAGLAKKNETLVYRINDVFYEVKLPQDTQGMRLLIQLRNEAHRFAQAYHHKLRLRTIK